MERASEDDLVPELQQLLILMGRISGETARMPRLAADAREALTRIADAAARALELTHAVWSARPASDQAVPRDAGAARAPDVPSPGPEASIPPHVLVVEDDSGVRDLIANLLRRNSYYVYEASRPDQAMAIAAAGQNTLDLLLVDMVLPDMSGPDLAEQIESLRPDVKTLFMSGYTDHALLRHRILRPGMQYLQKPFTPATLGTKVRELLNTAPA
jgi:CheY-like chemotaxis protein